VSINLASFDQSCNSDSDCVLVPGGGTFCDGYCGCPTAAINSSGQASYNAALSPLTTGDCFCPSSGSPSCQNHVCTSCGGASGGTCIVEADASSGTDGGEILPAQTPPGATFAGPGGVVYTFGSSCEGDVYYPDGSGWAFCDAGVWAFTTSDPSSDGYTLLK
jgi:hypothetical protein